MPSAPVPKIGIDFDGTLDESPVFFQHFLKHWAGEIFCITLRNNEEKVRADLNSLLGELPIKIILVNSFEEKAKVIEQNKITVFFDDQDEILNHIPGNVTVFKIRNGGNYDFEKRKWLFSESTGRKV